MDVLGARIMAVTDTRQTIMQRESAKNNGTRQTIRQGK
jgi:hypothetical protein